MNAANLSLRNVYNFDVYPAALLGSNFKNVTVLAIMDSSTAKKEFDAEARHIQVYPYLPVGTPNKFESYDYVKIKMMSGEITILGLPWIKEETVELVTSKIITVVINDVTASDIPRIRNALVQNGFSKIGLSIE